MQGEIPVAVRPALPVEGIGMIWGNDLVGRRMWADMLPPPVATMVETQVVSPVVTLSPLVSEQPDGSAVGFPEGIPACAVIRVMSG